MFIKSKQIVIYLYSHSFIRYMFVGGSTFLIDILLLTFLHGYLDINLTVATSLSYWIAIAYNFIINRQWTFTTRDKANLHKHLTFYLLLLGFNYSFTVVFVSLGSTYINYALAKVVAAAVQVSWTYYIYKTLIFKEIKN